MDALSIERYRMPGILITYTIRELWHPRTGFRLLGLSGPMGVYPFANIFGEAMRRRPEDVCELTLC